MIICHLEKNKQKTDTLYSFTRVTKYVRTDTIFMHKFGGFLVEMQIDSEHQNETVKSD